MDDSLTYGRRTVAEVFALPGNIKVVTRILWRNPKTDDIVDVIGLARTPSNPPNMILVSGYSGYLLAHEWGHTQGTDHNNRSSLYIMWPYAEGGTYIDQGEEF